MITSPFPNLDKQVRDWDEFVCDTARADRLSKGVAEVLAFLGMKNLSFASAIIN
jgi:hypothetical protein